MDIAGFSEKTLIARDSNPGRVKTSAGGTGRNIAELLATLGINVKLFSAVGNDAYGQEIIATTQTAGVDTQFVKVSETHSTSVYLAVINANGEMEAAVSDMRITELINKEWLQKHEKILEQASCIIVDTNLSQDVLAHITSCYADKLYLDTVSTTKAKKVKDLIGQFHTIKPNRKEAEILSGLQIDNKESALNAVSHFITKGAKNVFISLGRQGIVYGNSEETGALRVDSPKNILNTTGAGDAFLATLVHGFLNNRSIAQSAKEAYAASLIILQSEDTSNNTITIRQIESLAKELNYEQIP